MEVPRYWRQRKQRYSMVGEVCLVCNKPAFPPRAVCPHCSEINRQQSAVMQQSTVVSFAEPVEALKR